MTKEQFSKLPLDQMFDVVQELLKGRQAVRVYHQDINDFFAGKYQQASEAGFYGLKSYLRHFGINAYRADHSSFGCSFVEVDNLPDVLPKGIEVVDHDFEDKRLIFAPTNIPAARSFIDGGSGLITDKGFIEEK
jgi:hypothetical protein